MKQFFGLSFIGIIVFLSTVQTGLTSCTKEKILHDTVTVIKNDTLIRRDTIFKKDTVVIRDTALNVQILTANPWKIQEISGVEGGTSVYYVRGNSNYTQNYDKEYIIFKSDKTGTYYDANGNPSSLIWDFANSTNTKIIYTVNFPSPGPTVVTWDNIIYKNASLKFDQYWSQGSLHAHEQLIRTPK